jgi:AcrR family transcriptional regulator
VRLGFERATNKDIATAAGITAAALYRYFDAKSEIYAAVVDESSAQQVSRVGPLVEAAPTVRAGFAAVLRTLGDDSQNVHSRFLSAVPTEMQRHPEIAKHMIANPGELYAIIRRLVESGVRSGEVAPDKVERTVAFMIASFIGISSYINTLGRKQGEIAVAGLLDLLDGRLFG